jgi:murein DD-endopeptidase MepM/ murein hydrolase activator NlpD
MYSLQGTPAYYLRNIEEYRGRNDPEAVKAVAKEMEALFVYELIKAMRQTTDMESSNGLGKDTYMSMFDMELSRLLAERGLGLQEMLVNRLNKAKSSESNVNDEKVSQTLTHNDGLNGISPSSITKSGLRSFPVHGIISSPFGMRRHPIYGDYRFHTGVDIAAPVGTPVYPVKEGKVVFSGKQAGYGNIVIIDHGNGLISKYAHNRVNLVQEGELVNTNTIIAQVGYTGESTGPHLHFEISDRGEYIDPMNFIARR